MKVLSIYKDKSSYILSDEKGLKILNKLDIIQAGNKVIVNKCCSDYEPELLLYGSLLLIAKDFGFPPVSISGNITNTNNEISLSKQYFQVAMEFLELVISKNINLKYEIFDNLFINTNLPIRYGNNIITEVIEELKQHLCVMRDKNFSKLINFMYRFDVPEKYFNKYIGDCKRLAMLLVVKEMQRYSYRIYYSNLW